MQRRTFIKFFVAGAAGAALARYWPDEGVSNPCYAGVTPQSLLNNELVRAAWQDINPTLYRDVHTHLIGTGDSRSGIYVNPQMRSMFSPAGYLRYKFYINAACADSRQGIDKGFVMHLQRLLSDFPVGAKCMLLAFDYHYDQNGQRDLQRTPFYTPNAYARQVAQASPRRFEWMASIHPYREDCVDALDKAVAHGARGVKWLPPVMGMDPASAKCDRFYEALVRHQIPLLTHAGYEHAVHDVSAQAKGNPLLLRRALDHGVRVIVAHCACDGSGVDLDKGPNAERVDNFKLFTRMLTESRYENNLFGDISAMTQLNHLGPALQTMLVRDDWHHRLVNGSDYPLPGVMPLFSVKAMHAQGYLKASKVALLSELRRHNPLLFDLVLKRHLRWQGKAFSPVIFESRRIFNNNKATQTI
jgi:predicted TIM-barrel fold metal-dependent hydrolase